LEIAWHKVLNDKEFFEFIDELLLKTKLVTPLTQSGMVSRPRPNAFACRDEFQQETGQISRSQEGRG